MNELQVRLSADISDLQSALKKAKQALKDFNETSEDTKGGAGFKRKIGLIEQLTNKAKALRTALSQATNETQIAKYNAQLEDTTREMARLNALGRSVSANLGSTGAAFQRAGSSIGGANAVAIEFNRVIQDAPFGLIGIGNNLQQLAGNFANVSKTAGGTGAAIKASLASIISPVNLGLLAISALTAGFTAYQMGAFDFIFSNEKAAKSLKELAEEIDNAESKTATEAATISALRTVIEDDTLARDQRLAAVNRLQDKYPEIFGNADKEKLLNGQLIQSYELLTKAIIQRAEASLAEERIPQLNKEKQVVDNQIQSLKSKLALEEAILAATSKGPAASGLSIATGSTAGTGQGFDAFSVQEAKVKDLNKEIDNLSLKSRGLDINIQGFAQSIISYNEEFINLLDPVNSKLDETPKKIVRVREEFQQLNDLLEQAALQRREDFFSGVEAPTTIESGKATTQGIIIPDEVQASVEENLGRQIDLVSELSGAYSGLGSLIGKAFGNPQFGNFLGQFIAFAAKLISTNFAIAGSNAAAGATSASLATGPAAPFTLPGFLAASLGLVASAFASFGGGGGNSFSASGGGGGSVPSAGRSPQLFTNAFTTNPTNPFNPFPTGNIDFDKGQGVIETRIDGSDIVFVYDRFKERQQAGG